MAQGGPSIGGGGASSSYASDEVNEQYLRSLMEMGIHREDARQVLSSNGLFVHILLDSFIVGFENGQQPKFRRCSRGGFR